MASRRSKVQRFLEWDGSYTLNGTCNQNNPPVPAPQPPNYPLIAMGPIMLGNSLRRRISPPSTKVSVRIVYVDRFWNPTSQCLAIKIRLKRPQHIQSMMLEIYKSTGAGTAVTAANLVYREVLDQNQVRSLLDHESAAPFVAPVTANRAGLIDSPYKIRVWVSSAANAYPASATAALENRGTNVHDQSGAGWGKTGISDRLVRSQYEWRQALRAGGTVASDREGINIARVVPMRTRVVMHTTWTAGNGAPPGTDAAAEDLLPRTISERVAFLFNRLVAAEQYITGTLNDSDDILRIFMAPEWYFKKHPYHSENERDGILAQVCARSTEYPNWLIIPGSVYWGRREGGVDKIWNTTYAISNGHVRHKYHKQHNGGDYTAPTMMPLDIGEQNGWMNVYTTWRGNPQAPPSLPGAESPFFQFDGLTCALEICMDTAMGTAMRTYCHLHPGGPGVDLHMAVSAGIPGGSRELTTARTNGYYLICNSSKLPAANKTNGPNAYQVTHRNGSLRQSAISYATNANDILWTPIDAGPGGKTFIDTPSAGTITPVDRIAVFPTLLQFANLLRAKPMQAP